MESEVIAPRFSKLQPSESNLTLSDRLMRFVMRQVVMENARCQYSPWSCLQMRRIAS